MKCTSCKVEVEKELFWHTKIVCKDCYFRKKEYQRLNNNEKKKYSKREEEKE